MITLRSKLPNLQTTIFTKMSALATQYGAINLSQGFPNFDIDTRLQELCNVYIKKGFNQYAPMAGVPALTQRLSTKIAQLYGQTFDPASEITITSGATQAIYTAITAFVSAGDEVIIVEPAYDSYKPAIELVGAKAVPYALRAANHWKINWAELRQLVTEKTSMIMLNTPHNPTGAVFEESDMLALEQLVAGTNILVLSDEVYEHLTFDGRQHHSILKYPTLRERSVATFSFGKTLHATGWKLGYIVGDARLMHEFRKVHQFNVFSSNTPFQYAIADYLEDESVYLNLPNFFQEKRDFFFNLLQKTPFKCMPCEGTYFQVADFSAISDEADTDFAVRLTQKIGVAVIPISVFYSTPLDNKVVRFCFAKTNDTLEQAAERLYQLNKNF